MKPILSYSRPVIKASAHAFCKQSMIVSLLLLTTVLSFSQELIKDINRDDNPEFNEYSEAVDVNDVLYYTSGTELWKTTGTKSSSVRVKVFMGIHGLIPVSGALYFVANDGNGWEIWKSNGTTAGTVKVSNIIPDGSGSLPERLTVIGTTLYFVANNGIHGKELWKTNGTPMGTVMVKDILQGLGGGDPSYLTNFNGVLVFSASNGSQGNELWKSDGTNAGTVMIRDIKPGSKLSSFPKHITNVNGVVYFSAIDIESGRELWKTNGTAEGTVKVKDIIAGPPDTYYQNFTAVDNTLFFSANDKIHGEELWKSDGTSTGTVMVKDLTPGSRGSGYRGSFSQHFANLKSINGKLYFSAYMNNDYYNWKSDGTEGGTIPFTDAGTLGLGSIASSFTSYNNAVYFLSGSNPGDNYYMILNLMKEDASGTITQISSFFLFDYYSSQNQYLVKSGTYLFLTGRKNTTSGYALFRSDGTPNGTQQVIDNVSLKDQSSSPTSFVKVGNIVYFITSRVGELGYPVSALWSTDGTTAGTKLVYKLDYFTSLSNINDTLYFSGSRNNIQDLYRKDGPATGVSKIPTPRPPDATTMGHITYANGKFFVTWRADYSSAAYHLWTVDGANSQQLATFSLIHSLAAIDNTVYFVADERETGQELWRSDGTVQGTRLVKDIWGGTRSSIPHNLRAYNNFLYFTANDGVHGYELWRSDGTESGTLLLKDLSTSNTAQNGRLDKFIAVNNELYFVFVEGVTSWLWKTDGTSGGTVMIKQVDPTLMMMNGIDRLYFLTYSSAYKLWSSKGTTASTQIVKDFNGAGTFGAINDYTMVDNILYLNDDRTIYRSDGTECGTFQLDVELIPITGIEALNKDLIFGAFRSDVGQELFKLNTTNISLPVCDETPITLTSVEQTAYYPNPFGSELTLQVNGPDGGSYNIQIYDMNNVLTDSRQELQYNSTYLIGASLRQGNYVLKINEGNNYIVKRIIKK